MRKYRTIFDSRDHMRLLVTVADAGSMSKAGEFLGMEQSTISRVIARLEKTVGCKLFTRGRGSHGVQLTMVGIIVVHHARMILRQMDEAERAIYEVRDILADLDRKDRGAP